MRIPATALLMLVFIVCLTIPFGCAAGSRSAPSTLVIAHRGASGYLPEHTLEAYAAAYFMGADMIEPDVVSTRDGHLVCLHDLYLDPVTDVEQRYPNRSRADGRWYVIDFDLEEVRTLNVTGRGDQDWNGMQIPTLMEMLNLIQGLNRQSGRRVGVIPEIKEPLFHRERGIDLAVKTINTISNSDWDSGTVAIQCFDADTLMHISERYADRYELVQLISDISAVPTLPRIADYARAIGPSRKLIDADPTLVSRANALGLSVYPYTFRDDPEPYIHYIHNLAVQGVFTDYTDLAVSVRDHR